MKLEFRESIIPEQQLSELGFLEYLDLFDFNLPIFPRSILSPMNSKEADIHFNELSNLVKITSDHKTNFKQLFKYAEELPNLDCIADNISKKKLDPHQLFNLGKFLEIDEKITGLEHGLIIKNNPCPAMIRILKTYLTPGLGSFIRSQKEKTLQNEIGKLEKKLSMELVEYEKDIHDDTGIRMIYPWPKEMPTNEKTLVLARKSKLVDVKILRGLMNIEYILPDHIRKIRDDMEKLVGELNTSSREKLNRITNDLNKFHDKFKNYYNSRKQRFFQYALVFAMKTNKLCLPELSESIELNVTGGRLPILARNREKEYVPLKLSLKSGPNVLFGANMAGKTTVLKTIFFLTTLARFGLPVPAKKFKLHFPKEINLHLKSSGTLSDNLSGFGEELDFFCHNWKTPSLILVDELFQSTNPIAGQELSKIFLEHFRGKKHILFCTTQYPEILFSEGLQLYSMKDLDMENLKKGKKSITDLLKKMPYEVERIKEHDIVKTIKESKKPLYIALHFPLSESIKNKIEKRLKG